MYQANMSDGRRIAKREAALAKIQNTVEYKAAKDSLENVPDPKDTCSKRTWEIRIKDLRVRIRSLKPDDEIES